MRNYRDIEDEISWLIKDGLVDGEYFIGEHTYEGQFLKIDYFIDSISVQIHNDETWEGDNALTTKQIDKIERATYQENESLYELDNMYHDYSY